MSTRLVILGLLRERALYGYELKQSIEEIMGDWTSIAFGSIYFALGKLVEEGYIEKVATEQVDKRPSRHVYQITPAGREEFLALLRTVWRDVERHYFTIDIGLFFMTALPQDEVEGYLRARVVHLEQALHYVTAHRAEELTDSETPRRTTAIFDHTLILLQAELVWSKDLLEQMERGEFP